MRLGTWNLDHGPGRLEALQRRVLASLELDILVLTEPGPTWTNGPQVVTSPIARVGPRGPEPWVAIRGPAARNVRSDIPFERLAAAALLEVDDREVLVYGSVLPWRSIQRHAPELMRHGERYADVFRRLLDEQVGDIERLRAAHPEAVAIWAGDFNQNLIGRNDTGSTVARQSLVHALERLGMAAWNRDQPHARAERYAIDLICGPADLQGRSSSFGPVIDGKKLSDHAGYVVDIL